MRDVIIDHINQLVRRPQDPPLLYGEHGNRFRLGPRPLPSTPQYQGVRKKPETDELSPWISTTANLDWALWYIAKLLSQMTHHATKYRYDQVKLSVISISTDRTRNKELYVAPFLSRPNETKYMNQVDKERYKRAQKSAILAKEVLFYGRIFKQSILADLTFTREVSTSTLREGSGMGTKGADKQTLPFPLPSVYYNPPEMHNPTFTSSWIGRLRWDPRLLNYEMSQYNRMKMMGSRCIWDGQPVDLYVPFFSFLFSFFFLSSFYHLERTVPVSSLVS